MKKFTPFLLLAAFVFMPNIAHAGLSEGCFPAVECDGTDDYYDGSCQTHINTVGADCPAPGAGKIMNFSCNNGCYETTKPAPNLCPGGVMISGTCYTLLDVVDYSDVYSIWDGTDVTAVLHVSAVCADDEVAVADATESTGWKCDTVPSLWSTDGVDVWRPTGDVGVGTATPDAKLDVESTAGGAAEIGDVTISATGLDAVAMGFNTTASNSGSMALGYNATASGWGSAALNGGQATNTSAFATGVSTASGYRSASFGSSTTASASQSTAMNLSTTATGVNSTAMGTSTTAQAFSSVAIGRFNVLAGSTGSWVTTDPLFVVGNGASAASRANALTVLKNGRVGIKDATPSYELDVSGDGRFTGDVIINGDTDNNGTVASLQIDYGTGTMLLDGNELDVNGDELWLNNNSTTDVIIANGGGAVGVGTSTLESFYGVTIREPSTSGLYTYGNTTGITAKGSWNGGIFQNDDGQSYAYVAYDRPDVSPQGIQAGGDYAGGVFYDTNSTGTAKVAYANYGIDARGSSAGGYFVDSDSGGYAYVGYGSTGIDARGSSQGGYFYDTSGTSYARAAYGNYGVYAEGNTAGGFFRDYNNTTTYTYVGYGSYSLYGNADGYFAGDLTIAGDVDNNGSVAALKVNYGSGDMLIDGNEIDSSYTSGLYLNNNHRYTVRLPSISYYSDRRGKDNIEDVDYGLDEVLRMRPVSYTFKKGDPNDTHIGFIAQEMEPIISEIVDYDADPEVEGMMSLDYTSLIPVLVNAVQELSAENDELQQVVCELKPDAEICN